LISSPFSFRTSVLLMASLAWGGELARAETMDELYEKAKQEKTLEFYAAGPTGSEDRWVNEFQQHFPGVHVEVTGGLSPGLSKRVDDQLAQKKMEVDIARFQTIQDFARWKQEGAMLLFKPDGFDKIDPAFKDEDGAFTPVSINTIGYAYNTELVGAVDIPKSALDFLKPLFKGKLITGDPTADDASLMAFNTVVGKYGWNYMDSYMANQPTFVTSGHETVSTLIAKGEKLATFDSTSTTRKLQAEGKPIEPLFSQADDTPVFLSGAGIFKDAPHPNAAKLYLTWFMAKEQQARTGAFSPRADVPPPAGMQPLSAYRIDSSYRNFVSDADRLSELRRRFGTYIHPH
jgi:ABC-type Fe3+ transport system substrate-binding protein